MSTIFAVRVPSQKEPVEVAFRCNGIRFINSLVELLPDNTEVEPLDNAAQGIYTIGDIKKEIEDQKQLALENT